MLPITRCRFRTSRPLQLCRERRRLLKAMLFAHCWQDPMTMAPALPGVCGDAKRVADAPCKLNFSSMAEIKAWIGAGTVFSSVLQSASNRLRLCSQKNVLLRPTSQE